MQTKEREQEKNSGTEQFLYNRPYFVSATTIFSTFLYNCQKQTRRKGETWLYTVPPRIGSETFCLKWIILFQGEKNSSF